MILKSNSRRLAKANKYLVATKRRLRKHAPTLVSATPTRRVNYDELTLAQIRGIAQRAGIYDTAGHLTAEYR